MNAAPRYRSGDPGSTSSGLLDRVQENDNDAWTRLVRVYAPTVYQWAKRLGAPPGDTDDTVQEVFLRVSRAIGNYRRDRENASFRGWLWTITRNVLLDARRRSHGLPGAVGGTSYQDLIDNIWVEESRSSEPRFSILSDPVFQRMLAEVRAEFKESTWKAFELSLDERGLSSAEIAEQLGMTKGAVRVAKCRVLNRLRVVFGELMDEFESRPTDIEETKPRPPLDS